MNLHAFRSLRRFDPFEVARHCYTSFPDRRLAENDQPARRTEDEVRAAALLALRVEGQDNLSEQYPRRRKDLVETV